MRAIFASLLFLLLGTPQACALSASAQRAVLGGASLSAEMVRNGGFDADGTWKKGTGWAIAGGVATKTAGVSDTISQPASLIPGQSYTLVFTVSGYSAGGANIRFQGGASVIGTTRSANGTYTQTLVAGPGNNVIAILGNATFAGSIDNVSVKLVIP
jgi:hypothetical protein